MPGRPVTLQDIAERLGLSKAAVSKGLRNHAGIPKATADRIKATAEEMGYRRNPLVAAHMQLLRERRFRDRRDSFAFLCFQDRRRQAGVRPPVVHYILGARYRARRLGYNFSVIDATKYFNSQKRLDDILYHRGIRGLIISPLPDDSIRIELQWDRYCLVDIGHQLLEPPLHRVAFDNFEMTIRQLEYLWDRGRRRIGLVSQSRHTQRVHHLSVSAFHNFWMRRGQTAIEPLIREKREDLLEQLPDWVRDNRIDAILGTDTDIVPTLVQAGLRVPDDVAFFNSNWLHGQPASTGMYCGYFDTGSVAVDCLSHLYERYETGLPRLPLLTLTPGRIVDDGTV